MFLCCNYKHTIQSKTKSYEVLQTIGVGAYSTVKMCRCVKTNQKFGIKMIDKEKMYKTKSDENILNEIKLQSKLEHRNILKIEECFEDLDYIYIVLEYCSFGHIGNLKKFEETKIFKCIYQINEGLIYMHSKNILHRDIKVFITSIKPENILLTDSNIIKIIDFNWAIAYTNHIKPTICGTTEFMPPEVVTFKAHTPKLDVWSLGVLFYQLVFGVLPFQGNTEEETVQLIINHNPFNNCHFQDIPTDLVVLMMAMLHKNVNFRPTAEQVRNSQWFHRHINYYAFDQTDPFSEIVTERGLDSYKEFCY